MTKPRSSIISLDATPYYHCISRCVRQAFLCGDDTYSGKNFDHRKPWLTDRIFYLASIFAIDIAAYAIMSNHYHLVLHVDTDRLEQLPDDEIVRRWLRLYKGPPVIHDYLSGNVKHQAQASLVTQLINTWRCRLKDISWFMRCLNEYIARKANHEDKCTGRFWEGRFKSQALLDESALLSCMAYVDLNPVRAGNARNIETSEYTSVQRRFLNLKEKTLSCSKLMPFSDEPTETNEEKTIPFTVNNYLELVDWTGRVLRDDKRGHINSKEPKLISILGLSADQWYYLADALQERTMTSLNGMESLVQLNQKRTAA